VGLPRTNLVLESTNCIITQKAIVNAQKKVRTKRNRMRSLVDLFVLIASLVATVIAGSLDAHHISAFSKRHARARVVAELDSPIGRSTTNDVAFLAARDLEKRFDGATFTFYDAGLGACGKTNTDADFIVALNVDQYGSGGYCFAMITIIANGKTATAQIMDECMGCPYGGLDFSRGLFDYFASESVGVLTGSWYFGTTPTTTSTSTIYTPTTTQTPTSTPTTTSTSSSFSSSVVSSFSSLSSTSSAADSSPSTSPNTTTSLADGVLEQLNLAFVDIGAIIFAAGLNWD